MFDDSSNSPTSLCKLQKVELRYLETITLSSAELRGAHFAVYVISELWLATRSSPQGAKCGGAEGNQTLDLYNANVALYQLSYSPRQNDVKKDQSTSATPFLLRGSQARRDQLSYSPGTAASL